MRAWGQAARGPEMQARFIAASSTDTSAFLSGPCRVSCAVSLRQLALRCQYVSRPLPFSFKQNAFRPGLALPTACSAAYQVRLPPDHVRRNGAMLDGSTIPSAGRAARTVSAT